MGTAIYAYIDPPKPSQLIGICSSMGRVWAITCFQQTICPWESPSQLSQSSRRGRTSSVELARRFARPDGLVPAERDKRVATKGDQMGKRF